MSRREQIGLSGRQLEAMLYIKSMGEEGVTIYDVAERMQISKATAYDHVNELLSERAVESFVKYNDRKKYYKAVMFAKSHMFPRLGTAIPSTSAAEFLHNWSNVQTLNEWPFMQTMAKIPYLIAKLADFAARWEQGTGPNKPEVDELRRAIILVQQRAIHMSKICQSLLDNKTLWDDRFASGSWFDDPDYPFTMNDATHISQHLENLVVRFRRNN